MPIRLPIAAPKFAERMISSFLNDCIKSYLYFLSTGGATVSELDVLSLVAHAGIQMTAPSPISLVDDSGGESLRVADARLDAVVRYNGSLYNVAAFEILREGARTQFILHVLGIEGSSRQPQSVLRTLIRESTMLSPLRNRMLRASSDRTGGFAIELEPMDPPDDSLDELFLPKGVRRDLDLFASSLGQEDHSPIPLRYLLSGQPGNGKTKVLRALSRACMGRATFLFADGSEQRALDLFEIASYFTPAVLCVDDVDLWTGSRRAGTAGKQLSLFLQQLDGFTANRVFLLATTNDKQLIDDAASRPGRFDRIIELHEIDPSDYAGFIRSKSQDPSVLAQFTDGVFELLRRKHATGAFIASLVKHFELVARVDRLRLVDGYAQEAVETAFEGFYRATKAGRGSVGFAP